MSNKKKIIIIGAGIAGLAAYARLREHGFETVILEARDRCGGRIYTERALGIPIGGGASWIHGIDNNPITQLAKHYNEKYTPVDFEKFFICDRHGQPIPQNILKNFNDKFDILLTKAKKFAFNSEHDISLAEALSGFIKEENFSPLEQDLFKRQLLFFEGYVGADYRFLSARYWDQEEAWPGDNCFVMEGYQSIIDGLKKDCQIQLNTTVKKINLRENDVEIITHDNIFYADAVLLTVPLGVLKKQTIEFNPILPVEKQKAIEHLGMGLFNITAIRFSEAFWPKEPHIMLFTQFDDPCVKAFFNFYHFSGEPILLGFSGGESARLLENFSDAELIEKTMQNFEKIYGTQLPKVESYFNTRWSSDPFSYGSYSYNKVGSNGSERDVLAQPVLNKLFFAGEATHSKYPATTHGAYLSGIREAERIQELFG